MTQHSRALTILDSGYAKRLAKKRKNIELRKEASKKIIHLNPEAKDGLRHRWHTQSLWAKDSPSPL
jgi:hypothetical protein